MDCSICGRKLKSKKSMEVGYGPVCYRKVFGGSITKKNKSGDPASVADDFPYYDIPGQMCLDDYLQEST